MTQTTLKCTTQYSPLHPSLISGISRRHTVCASHVVKSAAHKLRSHKYLCRYTRYVHSNTRPPLCPVSANTDASKWKQTVRQTLGKFSSTKFLRKCTVKSEDFVCLQKDLQTDGHRRFHRCSAWTRTNLHLLRDFAFVDGLNQDTFMLYDA